MFNFAKSDAQEAFHSLLEISELNEAKMSVEVREEYKKLLSLPAEVRTTIPASLQLPNGFLGLLDQNYYDTVFNILREMKGPNSIKYARIVLCMSTSTFKISAHEEFPWSVANICPCEISINNMRWEQMIGVLSLGGAREMNLVQEGSWYSAAVLPYLLEKEIFRLDYQIDKIYLACEFELCCIAPSLREKNLPQGRYSFAGVPESTVLQSYCSSYVWYGTKLTVLEPLFGLKEKQVFSVEVDLREGEQTVCFAVDGQPVSFYVRGSPKSLYFALVLEGLMTASFLSLRQSKLRPTILHVGASAIWQFE